MTTRENQLTDLIINGVQNSPALLTLDPTTRLVINQTVDQYVRENSRAYLNQIDQESNRQLDTIPKNLVGINNPLDIVSANKTSADVSSTLSPVVSNNLSNNISARLADGIFNAFSAKLPPIARSVINTSILRSGIVSSTQSVVPKAIDNSVSSFSTDLMSGKARVTPTATNVESLFATNPNGAIDEINSQFASSLSKEALSEAQKFDVNNQSNRDKLITQTTGFIDPAAEYPSKEYAGRSEVNKLATGDINGTIVQTKERERRRGIQLPNGLSFEQPPIPYNGEYPYNKVIQTESGHIIETDDTPGSERIHVYHRSGTFIEIDASGTIVKKTKGSSYEIIDRNGYISVNGDASVSVKGSVKVYVGGDADIEVEGDTNINCFNDITMQAAGRVDISATEEINLHSANINIEADINLNVKSDNDSFYTAGGAMHHKANGIMYSQTLSNYHLLAGGSIFNQSDSQIHFRAASTINADGSQIYWNSGTSSTALAANYSRSANIGLLGTRKDIVLETISDPISPSYVDKFSLKAEDSEFEAEGLEQQRLIKEIGVTSSDELTQSQIPLATETPSSTVTTVIEPNTFVLSQTYLPDSYQLSTNFNLGQLSSRAVVTNNPVVAQLGLSYGEIVYNLQGIALNILEPVLALYPNMFVTSAFRSTSNSSSTSDHPRGKAVDMQFRNVTKADYFEIAKVLAQNLNYDKLLLEYKTFGTGLPWIHISFDVNKQRKITLTYLNNVKYGSGLTNLA